MSENEWLVKEMKQIFDALSLKYQFGMNEWLVVHLSGWVLILYFRLLTLLP